MYPFNRAVSLTVEETNGNVENHSQETQPFNRDVSRRRKKPSPKTIVGNILDMSNSEDKWVNDLRDGQKDVEEQCSWRGLTCVSRCLRHILMLLKILALFPAAYKKKRSATLFRRVLHNLSLFNLSLCAMLFNLFLLSKNFNLATKYMNSFGLMHASTVSCIITGIKPLINAFVITVFAIKVKDHLRLIKTVDTVDVCFRSAFNLSPPILAYKIAFFAFTIIAFTVPFSFRVVEFLVTQQRLGDGILNDTAFVIVPILTLWNFLPLIYYDMYNRIVRFYCKTLIKSLNKEHKKRHFSLKFYYEQFIRITNVQEAIGNLFNPFVLFSLTWSVLVLCLTIYFVTQPTSSLLEPISAEQITNTALRQRLTRNVHFTMCWAGLQVLVALLHILVICSTGMATNETTRSIVNAVLRIVPDANADLDRFQISCFVHKMSTQFMWGMSVWRAFPLERTTFFTLVSVIVTYSFLLLKLKDNPAMMPIQRQVVLCTNATAP